MSQHSAPRRRWPRVSARGLGAALLACGVAVVLVVAYEAWGTNVLAHRAQAQVSRTLRSEWSRGDDPLALPASGEPSVPDGVGIANLFVPRLGRDYAWTIVQGTSGADLMKGPGHYEGTALPGEVGNFAVAGHRVGKGQPFLDLDQLEAGDPVVVETGSDWFVYRVKGAGGHLDRKDADGIPGRLIVSPPDTRVLLPLPDHARDARAGEKLMTMTTCTPKFSATHRMIVFARLTSVVPKQHDLTSMPRAIARLYAPPGSTRG